MFPLMCDDDRENMTRIWQTVMPAEAFAGATRLVEAGHLAMTGRSCTRRIPDLAGAH